MDAERLSAFSKLAGGVAVGVGLLVLAGWALDVEARKGPIPGLITMKANTALGFVLMGLALLALTEGERIPRRSAFAVGGAVLALAIGAISFGEYLLGRNLGIDELLFHDVGGGATVDPGRLAPQTAIVFVLLGAGLLMLRGNSRAHRWLGQSLPLAAAAVSLFALMGYIYGIERLSTVGPFSPMALHTAATSLLLSLGILFARPHWPLASGLAAATTGGIMARRLLPVALVGLPVLGWIRLYGENSGLYGREEGVALFALAVMMALTAVIVVTARALDRADTERRRASLEKTRLAAIVESSHDAILSQTPEGIITSWNPAAQRLYGYKAHDICGRSITQLVPPELAGEQLDLVAAAAAGRPSEDRETTHVRSDGGPVPVSISVSPVRDEEGGIVGVATIARDITDRKEAERALNEARAEAERANRAKSEFLSRMSHELRTPLNAILGFGQLLEMDELDASQLRHVEQIVKAGRHLLDLINEVLEISRIEAGEMAMSIEAVGVGDLLAETVDLMRPLAGERGLAITVADDETRDCHVRADNQRLKQVLLNLLSNAVKYNREGGSIDVSCMQAPDDRARIAVSDTGPGIPAERLASLFNPFERLGAERTGVEGTGLGLALSKRLVEVMGGTLAVESEPGRGTTFIVELPRGSDALQGLPEEPDDRAESAPALERDTAASVLYIEDNLSNYRLVEQILQKRPEIELIAAMEGQLGLDLARQHQPDLVLLDLHLPGMPGEQVLAGLREDPRTARIPVVVISADATDGQVKRLIAAGADAYLTKPIDVGGFIELLDEQLGAGIESSG